MRQACTMSSKALDVCFLWSERIGPWNPEQLEYDIA